MKIFNFNKRRAKKLFEQAQKLSSKHQHKTAVDLYLKSIRLDPQKADAYFQVGAYYKSKKQWVQCLQYSQRACALDNTLESARWNAGIAATALQRWDVARGVWQSCGFSLSDVSGPVALNLGMALIRLNPATHSGSDPEVVWATRIDPVRGRIDSIPYRESGFQYGDVVLLDHAASESTEDGDNEFPVFNVLQKIQPSEYKTSVAQVRITHNENLKMLYRIFSATPHELEDWTTNIHHFSQQTDSVAPPHAIYGRESGWFSERTLGVAIYQQQDVQTLFSLWQRQNNGILVQLD